MKITIACVGRPGRGKRDATQSLVDGYLERLPWQVNVRMVEDKRGGSTEQRKAREAGLLLRALPADAAIVALDERGKSLTSRQFAHSLLQWQQSGIAKIGFAIGGPDGLDQAVFDKAHLILSLSAMTWPHLLARVMLLEQLYRAWSLQTGHPYHRD